MRMGDEGQGGGSALLKARQSVAETTLPHSIAKRTASSKPHRAQIKATPLELFS